MKIACIGSSYLCDFQNICLSRVQWYQLSEVADHGFPFSRLYLDLGAV